jgi:DNA polymerase
MSIDKLALAAGEEIAKISNTLEELEKNLNASSYNLSIRFDEEGVLKPAVFSDKKNLNSDIFVLGEAPGEKEEQDGIPFVGHAGKNLDSYLEKLLERKDLYITNTCFWRPTKEGHSSKLKNRSPSDLELSFCIPILEKHIFLKKPKIIICLGGTALRATLVPNLDKKLKLGDKRLKLLSYMNSYLEEPIKLIVANHPSPSNNSRKKEREKDFEFINDFIKKHF